MNDSKNEVNRFIKKQITEAFVQLIADIKTKKEAEIFINDFLTPDELETYSKRLAVVYWLKKGRSVENIENNLKVQNSDISSIRDLLNTKGLRLALRYLEAEEWANVWSSRIKSITKKLKK